MQFSGKANVFYSYTWTWTSHFKKKLALWEKYLSFESYSQPFATHF